MPALADELREVLGRDRVVERAALGSLTTFRVGGAADLLVEARNSDELLAALRLARAHGAPVVLLGGGSNVLVGDRGVRGLVVRPHGGAIARVGSAVRADAGVTLNGLVRYCIGAGLAGLEAWAGTPGTVGGAIHGNAHFRGVTISAHVDAVRVVARDGSERTLTPAEMGFGYDRSRLQATGEVLLSADFRVRPGEPGALRATARASLAYRKRTQPLARPSAGCVFRNPDPAQVPAGVLPSAGALVDAAGLKGTRVGGACVSDVHANFFVNVGGATAHDVAALIALARQRVRERFGVALVEEIVRLGEGF